MRMWIGRLIALAIVSVLADATIASVRGTLIVLATVGIGTALALIVLALLWLRPWIAAAFAMLMLASAFAVGTCCGVPGGPGFTGVAPADAAAITFAAAIAAAAIAACLVLANVRTRFGVSVLAAYAFITTVASVRHGGLAGAFASAPLTLGGPYVAAEVFLPLAALAALIYALREFVHRRAANGAAGIVLAVALIAATQLGAFAAGAAGLPTIVAFEHIPVERISAAEVGQPPSTGDPQNATSVDGGLAAEAGALFVPKDSTGVPPEVAVAARLAQDPQHALEAVAGFGDDLYPGALAGSVGALRSGSANSVDKALLLRDLVRAGTPGIETAFAQCTLSATESDALVAQARAVKFHPKILMQAAGMAADATTDPAARATLQRWAQTWKALVEQTQDEGRKLAGELQTAGLALPPGEPTPDRLRALAAQHIWVRARVNGNWVDLDPTIEPATPGKTRCAAQAQTAALPDALYDVLGVRIAVEASGRGAPQRAIVFERSMRTADIGDRDVSFMFAENVGLGGAPSPAAPPPATTLTFTPLLRVGNDNLTGTAIVLPAPTKRSISPVVSGSLGSVASGFGQGAAAPAPTAPAPVLPTVSGAWMELSVAAPGSATTVVQSPIFDRIGYAVRAAHSAFPALAAEPDSGTYGALQTVWNIAVSAGHAASGGGPPDISAGSDMPALSGALARLNTAYFGLRRALVDDARGADVGVAAIQPGISLLSMLDSGSLTMDIASDGALPLTTEEARPTWAAAAVLAERAVVNSDPLLSTGNLGATTSNDALVAFDRATANGTHVVALHPADAPPPQSSAISGEARARISAHLAGGASVLALAPDGAETGGPTYAYWIVDPASGTLRDENAFGRHQEAEEEAETTEEIAVRNACKFSSLANKVALFARVAVLAIGVATGGQGDSGGAQLAKAVAKTIEAQGQNEQKRLKQLLNKTGGCKNGGGPPDP